MRKLAMLMVLILGLLGLALVQKSYTEKTIPMPNIWDKPIRWIFKGDEVKSHGMVGEAKRVLFQLKNIQNAGSSQFMLNKRYSDGSSVNVRTDVQGVDIVKINTPTVLIKEEEKLEVLKVYVGGADENASFYPWKIISINPYGGNLIWAYNTSFEGHSTWIPALNFRHTGVGGVYDLTADDSGIYTVGIKTIGYDQIWTLLKLTHGGKESFVKEIPFLENTDFPFGVITSGNYIYICGTYYDSNLTWSINGAIVKLDKDGNVIWKKYFPNQNIADWGQFAYIEIATDNTHLFLVGVEDGFDGSVYIEAGTVEKWDLDGNRVWSVRLPLHYSIATGDSYGCLNGIKVDGTHIYVIGTDSNTIDGDSWRITKLDKDGNIIWDINEVFGTNHSFATDISYDNNYLYISGNKFDSNLGLGNGSIWRVECRTKDTGDLIWYKEYNSGPNKYASGIDNYDGVYVCGHCQLDITLPRKFIVKKYAKSDGNLKWTSEIAGDNPYAMAERIFIYKSIINE